MPQQGARRLDASTTTRSGSGKRVEEDTQSLLAAFRSVALSSNRQTPEPTTEAVANGDDNEWCHWCCRVVGEETSGSAEEEGEGRKHMQETQRTSRRRQAELPLASFPRKERERAS
jgi:hypothetical protein